MKYLFILLILFSSTTFSQKVVVLDASGSGVSGGDSSTERIVSAVWNTVGATPGPVTYVTDTTGTVVGTNEALKVFALITTAGIYNFQVTITDNLGYQSSAMVEVLAYDPPVIKIKITPIIKVYL